MYAKARFSTLVKGKGLMNYSKLPLPWKAKVIYLIGLFKTNARS